MPGAFEAVSTCCLNQPVPVDIPLMNAPSGAYASVAIRKGYGQWHFKAARELSTAYS